MRIGVRVARSRRRSGVAARRTVLAAESSAAHNGGNVDEAPADDATTDETIGDAVVLAETQYAARVRRTVVYTSAGGGMLAGLLALLGGLTRMAVNSDSASISPVALSNQQGGGALLLLLPVSIALQVLLRMPRDRERIPVEEDIAHRQFWGNVSSVVATAAAFVAVSTFLAALSHIGQSDGLDVVKVFGVPAGAAIALLIAADAASLAELQADRLSLPRSRSDAAVRSIEAAIDRLAGKPRKRPYVSLVVQGMIVAALTISGGAWLAQVIVEQPRLTFVYAVLTTSLSVFVALAATRATPAVLENKILDALMTVMLPTLVAIAFVVEAMSGALYLNPGDDLITYYRAVAFGLLVGLPPIIIVAALTIPRGERMASPPLLAVARSSLQAKAERVKKIKERRESEPWRVFASLAMGLCLLPPAAFVLMVIATWQRREAKDNRRGLIVTGWVITVLMASSELALLALLPFLAAELGWFSLS